MSINRLKAEQVELIANSLLPTFIPKDKSETALTFHFTSNKTNYRVEYIKDKDDWKFLKYEEVE